MGQIYLTVSKEKRQPENDGYVAIISDGSPQMGDKVVTVLVIEITPSRRAARKWFRQMLTERPWETRQ